MSRVMLRKKGQLFSFVAVAMVLLFAIACARAQPAPTPRPTQAPTAQATPAPTLTPTRAPVTQATPPPAPTSTPRLAPTPTPVGEKPRYGGILRTANWGDPGHLDLHRGGGSILSFMVHPSYNNLVVYNFQKTSDLIPDLAERWEVSPDGKTYAFHLAKNARFHKGGTFDAEDAAFSILRLRDDPDKVGVSSGTKSYWKAVQKVEVVDKYTLRLTLDKPQSGFLYNVVAAADAVIYDKEFVQGQPGGKMDTVVNGTGPFILKDYRRGVQVELVKNKEYFKAGLPYLDGITLYVITDHATRFAAFRTGQVRLTPRGGPGLSASQAATTRKDYPNLRVLEYNATSMSFVDFNTSKPPWSDVRLRRAVYLALDRQGARATLGEGIHDIGDFSPAGTFFARPPSELSQLPGFRTPKDQDLAEAKRLLAQAGYVSGFETVLLARNVSEYAGQPEFVAEALSKIGIRAKIRLLESAVYFTDTQAGNYELQTSRGQTGTADPDRVFIGVTTETNTRGFSDQEIDRLYEEQSATIDSQKRRQIVLQLEDRVRENPLVIRFLWFKGFVGAWPEVRNYTPPDGIGNLNNSRMEDVWLAQ